MAKYLLIFALITIISELQGEKEKSTQMFKNSLTNIFRNALRSKWSERHQNHNTTVQENIDKSNEITHEDEDEDSITLERNQKATYIETEENLQRRKRYKISMDNKAMGTITRLHRRDIRNDVHKKTGIVYPSLYSNQTNTQPKIPGKNTASNNSLPFNNTRFMSFNFTDNNTFKNTEIEVLNNTYKIKTVKNNILYTAPSNDTATHLNNLSNNSTVFRASRYGNISNNNNSTIDYSTVSIDISIDTSDNTTPVNNGSKEEPVTITGKNNKKRGKHIIHGGGCAKGYNRKTIDGIFICLPQAAPETDNDYSYEDVV